MSETETNLETGVTGQEAPAQNDDDISTDAFDRVPEPEIADDPEASEGQSGDEGGEEATPGDDETDEIELDGQKYRIPKALKANFLMERDYRIKTHDLGEQRRAHEQAVEAFRAEEAQRLESLTAHRAEHVKIGVIEQTIEQVKAALDRPVDDSGVKLKDIDWLGYRRAIEGLESDHVDVLKYQKLRRAYESAQSDLTDLDTRLGQARTDLEAKEAARLADAAKEAQASLAKRQEDTGKALAKDIPGWNKDTAAKVIEYMAGDLGLDAEEIAHATDPRVWRLCHERIVDRERIATLEKALKQQQTAESHGKAQTTTPAATPKGGGGDPTRLRDDVSTEEWMRRRAARVAKARA